MGGEGLAYPRLPNIFPKENNTSWNPNPPAFCGPHPALMSGSRYTPPVEIRSAVWVMLNTLSLAVISLRDRFGIAACTPFLPRHVLTRLSRFLAQAEPALRRCLYLSAAELGALPAPAPARPVPAGTQPANRPAGRPAGRAAAPVFRLFETGTGRAGSSPPPKTFRTGPRIRFLDTNEIPDIREYASDPDDILPARTLVRRLFALDHALDHRDRYIRKLRRGLAAPRKILKPLGRRLYRRGPLSPLQGDTARTLDIEAQTIQPWFDSS